MPSPYSGDTDRLSTPAETIRELHAALIALRPLAERALKALEDETGPGTDALIYGIENSISERRPVPDCSIQAVIDYCEDFLAGAEGGQAGYDHHRFIEDLGAGLEEAADKIVDEVGALQAAPRITALAEYMQSGTASVGLEGA